MSNPSIPSERTGTVFFEVPGYQIIEWLSEDAVFKIYRAKRLLDNSTVILKVLNRPYPTLKLLAPLWQEFEILRGLDIPGVEKAYALENHEQWWMLVIEDFIGQPLNTLGIAGRMRPEEFINLALNLIEIVGAIHTQQVIHKNISPSNISFSLPTGTVKLINFGNASLVSREKAPLQNPYKLARFLAYISPEMTGRMNRLVDYRTDYYSLGASLYELLTGTPPFLGQTPLELVHAHLAVLPAPPDSRIEPWKTSPSAFQIVSLILQKLLAKNPEDRYQTITALDADLRYCLAVLSEPTQEGIRNPTFVPGLVDRSVHLDIPQIVVGRELQADALLQVFLETVRGPRQLVLVTGEAGIGKTTLVNQLIRPVTERTGFFLYGKFDQVHLLNVYKELAQVLDEFCRQVLSEPSHSFEIWRAAVQSAVTPHGQLLIDLCPQMEKVIGIQTHVVPIDEDQLLPRLYQVMIRFLQTICQPEHPVVIFLDDMQWINPDSCMLWQSILSAPTLKNLMVIGAYRENEVDAEHPIQGFMRETEKALGSITRLELQNLDLSMVNRLIAFALASDPEQVSDLASVVYQKTNGNPYFSNELLKSLNKDQLLVFNLSEQRWRWDSTSIEKYLAANDVVDLFVNEFRKLDADTQKTLQYAALIGRRFDAATLLTLLGKDKASLLANSLWVAVKEGLIHPLDENYRYLAGENTNTLRLKSGALLPSLVVLLEEQILFEFQHDRVQQAALAMLGEQKVMEISLQMGRLLLAKAKWNGEDTVSDNLLAIVDHLNAGAALIQDPAEAVMTARLNLMAGNQARIAAGYGAASRYMAAGMQLLPSSCWQDYYTLTIDLFTTGAEVAFLNGDLKNAEALCLAAEPNAGTLLEKARIMRIRMDTYMIQTRIDEVFKLGIEIINMLGFDLEARNSTSLIPERAMQLPVMTDPLALEVSRLDELMISAGYANNDPRLDQVVLFYIELFSRYGNPPTASYMYVSYAVILMLSRFLEMKEGCQLGRMALELAEKGGPSRTLYAVRYVYYGFVHHWWRPARECIDPLNKSFQPAVMSGNLWYSISMQDLAAEVSLFVGDKLEDVQLRQAEALHRVEFLQNVSYTQRLRIWSQVVENLIGASLRPQEIDGELFDEDEAQKLIDEGINYQYMFYLYTARAFLNFLFRQPRTALEACTAADVCKDSAKNYLIYTLHLFIYSLGLLSAGQDVGDLPGRLEKVEQNLVLMRLWTSLVPVNFQHQLELVEAEQARCLGHISEAAENYERSIEHAKRNGYIHESALAAELAAEFYLSREKAPKAKDHLLTAYYSYQAWGAKAKLIDLENRYPEWLPPRTEEVKQIDLKIKNGGHSPDEITTSIDLSTILKASLELAQQTNLDELLRRLMSFLIENTGAQNGSLILWREDGWYLEVQRSAEPEQKFAILSIPLKTLESPEDELLIPLSVVNYVINSQVDLVLEDASNSNQFSQDPYIQSRQPKSILCAPLLNQGVLRGVVYLENNLITGAFASDRLEIVHLISGQAAASIENARLYEHLETLVEKRTLELSETNRKLIEEIDVRTTAEEALRLSEARYRAVFETTGTAMALINEKGDIQLTNDEFVRLTGYSKDELENNFNSLNIVAPGDASRILQFRKDRLADPSRVPNSFEFTLIDRSGREKAVINTATILPGSKSIVISLIDISQRKVAEEAVRYNEGVLRKVLEILPVGVWIIDKTPKIVSGNPESQRIWAGAKYVEMQKYGEYLAWRLENGEKIKAEDWAGGLAVTEGKVTLNEELEIEAFDGTHRFILNSAIPLEVDEDGLIGAIVVNQDITKRKQDQEELQKAHDQLSTLLQISQSIVSTLDLDQLLNLIIEQLGKVMPYDAAAILILEQNFLRFQVIRGPSDFQSLLKYQFSVREQAIIAPLINGKEAFYFPDIMDQKELMLYMREKLNLPSNHIEQLRSWLILPLIVKDDLIGALVLAHSQPDNYSQQSRALSQVYANQVAIAIQNAQLYKRARTIAALEERNRLARELHDSVAQALYSISLFTDATRLALEMNKLDVVSNHLEDLVELSREAMSDMRLMIYELRPPIIEREGLAAALQSRLDSVEARAGFQAIFKSEGEVNLSADEEGELYRIAQEALNNVIKHAHAKLVRVLLSGEDSFVYLTIEDDGVGFDPVTAEQGGGQGIRNIRERAEKLGATCQIVSTPNQGTKISIEVKK